MASGQRRFADAVATAWGEYQRWKIAVSVRALRVMYQWGVEEFPCQVQAPTPWPEVRWELARFL